MFAGIMVQKFVNGAEITGVVLNAFINKDKIDQIIAWSDNTATGTSTDCEITITGYAPAFSSTPSDSDALTRLFHQKGVGQTYHVVAWQSTGSGGHDWYYRHEDSVKAFETEKNNCHMFAAESWECLHFSFAFEGSDPSDEIDDFVSRLTWNTYPTHYECSGDTSLTAAG